MSRKDTYEDYYHLLKHEQEGRDFRVLSLLRGADVAVIAPHGGGIEPGTSEIARAVAGDVHPLYLFEGIKQRGNLDLHITSERFNEPRAKQLVEKSQKALAIHGEGSSSATVFIGGRDCEWANLIDAALTDAGFETAEHKSP